MTAALWLPPCSKCAPTANAAVQEAIAGAEAELDGRGRLVIRPSGTEPVIRVMTEGDDRGLEESVIPAKAGISGRSANGPRPEIPAFAGMTATLWHAAMLEMRPDCERCGVDLPADQAGAFICSFECTFCAVCADALDETCPNCGGELLDRPARVGDALKRNPASTERRFRS